MKNQFATQFYRFAKKQFEDEISEDFPRLRSVLGSHSRFTIDTFDSLIGDERRLLMEGCLRRAHPSACAALDEPLKQEHIRLLNRLDEARVASGGEWRYIPLRSRRRYSRLFAAQGRVLPVEASEASIDNRPARLNQAEVFGELKVNLTRNLWHGPSNWGAGEWEFVAHIHGVRATLNLDFGTAAAQLVYWHDVCGVQENLSIGKWLGVGDVAWDLCTIDDSKRTGQALASLVNEFATFLYIGIGVTS